MYLSGFCYYCNDFNISESNTQLLNQFLLNKLIFTFDKYFTPLLHITSEWYEYEAQVCHAVFALVWFGSYVKLMVRGWEDSSAVTQPEESRHKQCCAEIQLHG